MKAIGNVFQQNAIIVTLIELEQRSKPLFECFNIDYEQTQIVKILA